MSINKSKGIERKIVFFYCLDEHFDFIQNTGNDLYIPNILYVGLTRSFY